MRILHLFILICSLTLISACNNKEQANTSKTLYTAHGENPSWDATIKEDNTVIVQMNERKKTYTFKTQKQAYAKGVNYVDMSARKPFMIALDGRTKCTSERTKKALDMVVYLELNAQEFRGCGTLIKPLN